MTGRRAGSPNMLDQQICRSPPPHRRKTEKRQKSGLIKTGVHLCVTGAAHFSCCAHKVSRIYIFLAFTGQESLQRGLAFHSLTSVMWAPLPRDPHFTIKCPKNNSRLRRGNGPRRRGPSRSQSPGQAVAPLLRGRAGEPAGPP